MRSQIRTASHFLAIFLVMSVDVRVRALTIEEPKKCLHNQYDNQCAVYTENLVESISLVTASAKLSRGSSAERVSGGELKLVRGVVKVRADALTTLQTIYGNLELSKGEVLVEVRDTVIKFTNLSSDLKYSPRGETQKYMLPMGFSTYFAGITKTGVAEAGYPKPAEIEPLIKNWSKLYSLAEKPIFSQDLKNFMKEWHRAAQMVGPWYVDVVKRQIASQEAEEARQARLKAERELENDKYKKMFRERIFGEQ